MHGDVIMFEEASLLCCKNLKSHRNIFVAFGKIL